jgi:taurine--2-oxoglutarate transaminase
MPSTDFTWARPTVSAGTCENPGKPGRDRLEPGLNALAEKHAVIGEVRGHGAFWALELVQDRTTRPPVNGEYMGRLKGRVLEELSP